MSSYFGDVEIPRADKLIGVGSYLGVSPEFATVLYKPGDHLGRISAIASLIPIAICVALFTVFLARRTADDLWVGCGQIACEILNGVIKVYVKQPRPISPVTNIPADSFGMPSAHSQYMGYFAMVMTINTLNTDGLSPFYTVVRILGIVGISVFTAYSRYYLYYHTGMQVIVGYLIGSALGFIWMKLGLLVRKCGLMQWGLNLWPCRLMLVKDTPYSVYNEYQEYRKKLN